MNLEFASFSNVGPRKANEDRLLPPVRIGGGGMLFAIADGIGGALGGAEAAVKAIEVAASTNVDPSRLADVFSTASSQIADLARQDPSMAKAGTTLSLAAIVNKRIYVAHVGDTRIYHLRGKGLNALTQDQTEIAELVRRGVFTSNQALRYPRRNVLLSALTAKSDYDLFLNEAPIEPGDRFLLLSDGVYNKVKRGAILNLSLEHKLIKDWVSAIEQRVVESTPNDNFTALGVEVKSF